MKFLKLFRGNTSEPLPEAQRLAAYRLSGDVSLLGELYAPYMEMVFGICYRYLRNEEESKDAVMQLFEKLVIDLKTHEVGNFRSWLHSVARNHCLMKLRAERVLAGTDELSELEIARGGMEEGDGSGLFSEGNFDGLARCMKKLSEEQRKSVELFYMHDKCYRDISDATGFDLNKVKSYIQNGKRNLKICMDSHGNN